MIVRLRQRSPRARGLPRAPFFVRTTLDQCTVSGSEVAIKEGTSSSGNCPPAWRKWSQVARPRALTVRCPGAVGVGFEQTQPDQGSDRFGADRLVSLEAIHDEPPALGPAFADSGLEMSRPQLVALSSEGEEAAGPERISGTGRNESPVQRSIGSRLSQRFWCRTVLRISEALPVGTLQGPGDGTRRVDGTTVSPIVAVLEHDSSCFFPEAGLAIGIERWLPWRLGS